MKQDKSLFLKKAAAFFLFLESDSPGITLPIFESIDPVLAKKIIKTMSEIDHVDPGFMQEVIQEFHGYFVEKESLLGGKMIAKMLSQHILKNTPDHDKAEGQSLFLYLLDIPEFELISYLKQENQQVVAALLNTFDTDTIMKVFEKLDANQVKDITQKMKNVVPTQSKILHEYNSYLNEAIQQYRLNLQKDQKVEALSKMIHSLEEDASQRPIVATNESTSYIHSSDLKNNLSDSIPSPNFFNSNPIRHVFEKRFFNFDAIMKGSKFKKVRIKWPSFKWIFSRLKVGFMGIFFVLCLWYGLQNFSFVSNKISNFVQDFYLKIKQVAPRTSELNDRKKQYEFEIKSNFSEKLNKILGHHHFKIDVQVDVNEFQTTIEKFTIKIYLDQNEPVLKQILLKQKMFDLLSEGSPYYKKGRDRIEVIKENVEVKSNLNTAEELVEELGNHQKSSDFFEFVLSTVAKIEAKKNELKNGLRNSLSRFNKTILQEGKNEVLGIQKRVQGIGVHGIRSVFSGVQNGVGLCKEALMKSFNQLQEGKNEVLGIQKRVQGIGVHGIRSIFSGVQNVSGFCKGMLIKMMNGLHGGMSQIQMVQEKGIVWCFDGIRSIFSGVQNVSGFCKGMLIKMMNGLHVGMSQIQMVQDKGMVWCFKRIEIFYTFGISKSSLIYSHFKEYLLHVNPIKPAIQWCLETKKSVLEDLEKMIQIASSFKIPLFFGKENKTILFGIFILMTIFMMCFTSVVLLWVSKNFLFLKRKEIVSK